MKGRIMSFKTLEKVTGNAPGVGFFYAGGFAGLRLNKAVVRGGWQELSEMRLEGCYFSSLKLQLDRLGAWWDCGILNLYFAVIDRWLMKLIIWVSGTLSGLGAILCGYGFFAVEPKIFEVGLGVICFGVAVALAGLLLRWVQSHRLQTVACAQCGVNQKRYEMRFGRCFRCREENQRQAMVRAAAEKERRKELARMAEEVRAQQQWSKLTGHPHAGPPAVVAPRKGRQEVGPRRNEALSAERVPHGAVGNIAMCPRCQSPSIQFMQRGYSAGAGAVGWCLIGPAGMLLGAFGASQADRHCLNCRYKW